MVRRGHLIAVVGTFLIGCTFFLVVGCAGTISETSKKEQDPTQATKEEQTRSPEATASEETTASDEATTAFEDLQREDVLQAPPDGTLSYRGRELRSWITGGVCWQTTRTNGGCMPDSSFLQVEWQLKKKLYVPPGAEMVFHYEAPRPPNEVTSEAAPLLGMRPAYSQAGNRIPGESEPDTGSHVYRLEVSGSGVERTIPAELPPREYVVSVRVTDPQVVLAGAYLEYYFRVKVE